jgi:hypothetical protein
MANTKTKTAQLPRAGIIMTAPIPHESAKMPRLQGASIPPINATENTP